MLWIQLIFVFIILFAGLAYFFWHLLIGKAKKATGDLRELSKDLVAKEEEASRVLQNAQREAKGILSRETEAAEQVKAELIKNAQESCEKILKDAQKKGIEIAEKAERNAEFLRNEFEQKIDESAKEKVQTLIQQVIPQKFLEGLHQLWMDDSDKAEFNLKHLKLPENTKDIKIVSAFPLTDKQQENLKKKLKKKIGNDVTLKTEVNSSLLTGFTITVGSIVVDASLKYKIQKGLQEQ